MANLLEMRDITKKFGAVIAVDQVSISVAQGTVLSLCGENGSGKSTLMKVLCGIYPHGSYTGTIEFAQKPLTPVSIRDTENVGIAIIHQELALVKEMTVLENMFLGCERTHWGIMDYERMYLRCQQMLEQVRLNIDPNTRVGDLGLGQQQLVEIAKALNKQVRLLVLDEPSASLTEQETSVLLDIVRDLREHGIACIYISHKLNEVKAISDHICVIRDGKPIATRNAAEVSEDDIIAMMVGRELNELYPPCQHTVGSEILRVEHVTAWHPVNRHIRRVDDVSFTLHRHEILGVAGLVGSGRTELAQCLFGAYPGKWQGQFYLDQQPMTFANCRQALAHGVVMVPEDRKRDGIVPILGVGTNITLAALDQFASAFAVLDQAREQQSIDHSMQQLNVKASSADLPIASLSGGNQQKAVLARFLLEEPQVLILDEPTRGIDIGAKHEIYKLIHHLAEQGIAVIVISSELPEVLGLSDRVLVMHEGQLKADLVNDHLTQQQVMEAALRSEPHVESHAV